LNYEIQSDEVKVFILLRSVYTMRLCNLIIKRIKERDTRHEIHYMDMSKRFTGWSVNSIIMSGIGWKYTPEGSKFWSKVHSQKCIDVNAQCYEYKLPC
jgi:hypothetical protein